MRPRSRIQSWRYVTRGIAVQGGGVIVGLRADDREAPGIGDPLPTGQLVGDAVPITSG